uniref:Uncharacterized protein n=1 Tax=Nannospalax galili TaxID=1026970 RepID=A0A8C6QMT1_NANGA
MTSEVVHTCPTIGSNVEEIILQKTPFLMWDMGCQEALHSTWNYSNTEVRRVPGLEDLQGSC